MKFEASSGDVPNDLFGLETRRDENRDPVRPHAIIGKTDIDKKHSPSGFLASYHMVLSGRSHTRNDRMASVFFQRSWGMSCHSGMASNKG